MDENKRKKFIERITHALGRNKMPDHILPLPYEEGPQYKLYQGIAMEELVEMFRQGCKSFDTNLVETTAADFPTALLKVIEESKHEKIAYSSQGELAEYNLPELFKNNQVDAYQWDPSKSREENIGAVSAADIGITFADYGVAETGTIIQASTPECGRSLSLLPYLHIGVLHQSSIVPRLTQSMALLEEKYKADPDNFPTNICHISGPSRTADIELVNVMGAHGPVAVTFILITDK